MNAKFNVFMLKAGQRAAFVRAVETGLTPLIGGTDGLRGILCLGPGDAADQCIVITLWESAEAMSAFYRQDNAAFREVLRALEGFFAATPLRQDCEVALALLR